MLFSATEKSVKLWSEQQIHEERGRQEMEQQLPINSSAMVSVMLLETENDGSITYHQDFDHKTDPKVSLQSQELIMPNSQICSLIKNSFSQS